MMRLEDLDEDLAHLIEYTWRMDSEDGIPSLLLEELVKLYAPDRGTDYVNHLRSKAILAAAALVTTFQPPAPEPPAVEQLANDCHNPTDGRFCGTHRTIHGPLAHPEEAVGMYGRSPVHTSALHTLDAIATVHYLPSGDFKRVPLKATHKDNPLGEIRADGDHIEGIYVSSKGDHPELTFAHEFGHYIDFYFVDTTPIFDAIQRSPSYQNLVQVKVDERQRLIDTGESNNNKPEFGERISYYLSQKEAFARAYAQYIAVRSGDPKLNDGLTRIKRFGDSLGSVSQWNDDEFEPIAQAFDALFESKGLLRASAPAPTAASASALEKASRYADYLRAKVQEFKNRGNPEALIRYWREGEGAVRIGWGTKGDFTRCMQLVGKYLPDDAGGFCQNRHMEIYGESNAARDKREDAKAKASAETEEFANPCHDPQTGRFCETATSNVDVDTVNAQAAATLRQTMEAISNVHALPATLPKIQVDMRTEGMGNSQGIYSADGKTIHLSEPHFSTTGRVAFVHEFGHHLSMADGGLLFPATSNPHYNPERDKNGLSFYAKAVDNGLEGWWRAVRDSKAHEHITKFTRENEYAAYLAEPHELFARSYVQYIATHPANRSNTALRDQFERARYQGDAWQTQWTDTDFEPIAQAFDEYFSRQQPQAVAASTYTEHLRAKAVAQLPTPVTEEFHGCDQHDGEPPAGFRADIEEFYNKCHAADSGKFCSEIMASARGSITKASAKIRQAVSKYTGSRYIAINGALRGDRPSSPAVDALIEDIDEAFEKHAVTTKGITVYRGLPIDSETAKRMLPGEKITDAGFMSTSVRPEDTSSFTTGGGTVIRIRTRANTKAVAGSADESELILPRGTVIQIKSRTQKRGYTEVVAEVAA